MQRNNKFDIRLPRIIHESRRHGCRYSHSLDDYQCLSLRPAELLTDTVKEERRFGSRLG